MATALYIHVPFCDQICSYCDFPKVFTAGQNTDAYLDGLIKELEIYEKRIGFSALKTIYIGGGTPTVLTIQQLNRLFGHLHSVINFKQLIEVSIEANPDSLNDDEKIDALLACGVTRISLGVQTFDEGLLKILQRSHKKTDVIEVIHKLSTKPVEINVDMIYGIPSQTLQQLDDDLDTLLSLPITHISAYSLILEAHTKFYVDYMKDNLDMVSNDVEAAMFERVIHRLNGENFAHYEISNYTRGNISYHNATYWENQPYIAVGLGAHGQLEINGKRERYENTRSITAYKKSLLKSELPVTTSRILTEKEVLEETMFLGLRLLKGVDFSEISKKFSLDVYGLYDEKIKALVKRELVDWQAPVLKLTQKGVLLANEVFEMFLLDE